MYAPLGTTATWRASGSTSTRAPRAHPPIFRSRRVFWLVARFSVAAHRCAAPMVAICSYSYAHGTAVSSSDHSRENGPERAPTRWASQKWLKRRRDSNTRTFIESGQNQPVKRYSNPWTFSNRRRVLNKKTILKKHIQCARERLVCTNACKND